jgi:hypothetical protein
VPTGRAAAGALMALLVVTGCSSGDGSAAGRVSSSEQPSRSGRASPSPSLSVVPAPTSIPSYDPDARIPVGPQTAPDDFPGDDEHFLAVARGLLIALDTEAPASDQRLVAAGREFCSLLSGGGAVASKLDMYAGQRNYAEEGWTAVILAGIQEYCPELGPGYFADRSGPLPMTSAEKLDLFRYATRNLIGVELRISDRAIERLATRTCLRVATDPDELLEGLDLTADREALVAILAAILAFCPGDGHVIDDLMSDLA